MATQPSELPSAVCGSMNQDKWLQPGWRIEQTYANKVLLGNWAEERLEVRQNPCPWSRRGTVISLGPPGRDGFRNTLRQLIRLRFTLCDAVRPRATAGPRHRSHRSLPGPLGLQAGHLGEKIRLAES